MVTARVPSPGLQEQHEAIRGHRLSIVLRTAGLKDTMETIVLPKQSRNLARRVIQRALATFLLADLPEIELY